jgi:hypothetical protein
MQCFGDDSDLGGLKKMLQQQRQREQKNIKDFADFAIAFS